MNKLVELLKKKQYTIASIESLTAGLFSSKLAEVPGASAVLKGGLVTYQTICKEEVLHCDHEIVSKYGVISDEVAKEMVVKGERMFHSDVVVSFTGNAGPDVMDEKPAGEVHMAIWMQGAIYLFKQQFKGSRNEVREQSCQFICEKLKKVLQ